MQQACTAATLQAAAASSCRLRASRRIARRRAACAALSRPPEQPPPVETAPVASPPSRGPLTPLLAFVDDRLRADPRYLNKIGIEVAIDSSCTLAAELVARGAAAFGACALARVAE